jgi:hypothetical protein
MKSSSLQKIKVKSARHLVIGDKLQSATGKILKVTLAIPKGTRIIVLFNGDMEVDFDPWCQLQVLDE